MRILIILFSIFPVLCHSQTAYKTDDVVADLPIRKMLNQTSSSSTLKKIQSTITIIDFFGTWCVPCIKALPEFADYKNKFKDDISILLVSIEAEAKLTKFINSRQPFPFPMVVDEDSRFTNAFNPPSYPYTVVLDKNLKVLSITNAADLTQSSLAKFIEDGKAITETKALEPIITDKNKTVEIAKVYTGSKNVLVKLSQDFMYAAKTNEATDAYITQLQNLNYNELLTGLKTDDDKKAFWINLYNAYTNASLHANPDQYKNRSAFFKNKNIIVAGKTFSLDKIEHGILRRSKIKWSLGYFSKLFPDKTEKDLRVDKLDYRIHFALTCGAKSCPPIAFYNPENLNTQLDVATKAYLTGEAEFDKEKNNLYLPALLNWFRRDFGGKKKIIGLIKKLNIIPVESKPKIKFKKYDWSLYLDNFKK